MDSHQKVLLIRLSSLGDVILSLAALESESLREAEVHFLTSPEYIELVESHPRVKKVISFDRKRGMREWLSLWSDLRSENYSAIYDLHGSLRTRIARFLHSGSNWVSYSKERTRLRGYFLFKTLWPKSLRPTPCSKRFALAVGGKGTEKPSLAHLLADIKSNPQRICVMPSSKWPGKNWPVKNFADAIEILIRRGFQPVILGSAGDKPSLALLKELEQRRLPHQSQVGKMGLKETANFLAGSQAYFGNDTGLGHLAEAVGIPAWVVFGPTTPDMGFGPWRPQSRVLERPLWCRPCSKDGQACFRLFDRYRCMKNLSASEVIESCPS